MNLQIDFLFVLVLDCAARQPEMSKALAECRRLAERGWRWLDTKKDTWYLFKYAWLKWNVCRTKLNLMKCIQRHTDAQWITGYTCAASS